MAGVIRARLSLRSKPGALDKVGVAWQATLPRAQVRAQISPDAITGGSASATNSSTVPARIEIAALQLSGGGTLDLGSTLGGSFDDFSRARFDGVAKASVARAAVFTKMPTGAASGANSPLASLNGANLRGVSATARFGLPVAIARQNGKSAARLANADAVSWAAQVRVAGASLPLPADLRLAAQAPAVQVGSVQLALGSDSGAGAQAILPRVSLQLAGGRVDGSLRLGRDGSVDAQLLASNLDARPARPHRAFAGRRDGPKRGLGGGGKYLERERAGVGQSAGAGPVAALHGARAGPLSGWPV